MDRGTWGEDGPPEEAYSRVSEPALYRALHPVADRLVARLVSGFRVEAGPAVVEGRWRGGVERCTRLVPDGGGASLTVIWTGFGVVVRAGHVFERGFPVCGCDACDEDPDELARELEEVVERIVGGGLVETRRPRRLGADEATVELRHVGGATRSSGRLTEPRDRRHAIPTGTTAWPVWLPR